MKRTYIIAAVLIIFIFIAVYFQVLSKRMVGQSKVQTKGVWWEIESIDTMKYSRDVAREKEKDLNFDKVIDTQVKLISKTGASHVAIGTPYDEEFLPFLEKWVWAARRNNLKVWFRGNMAGWEGWFGYKKIGREEHINKIRDFILANGDLFEEGDIFSACPECENGGPGDPRRTGDSAGHRKFLIDEYKVTSDAFRKIGKNVRSNFAPMNGDVAELIMDKQTTQALGGVVVIDHYVREKETLAADIKNIAEKSGGKVILGEFGAPIPDIHGNLTPEEQAVWVEDALTAVSGLNELAGVNYWTAFGGSTKLWDDNSKERPVVPVLKKYFKPNLITGKVINAVGEKIAGAKVSSNYKSGITDSEGNFSIPTVNEEETLRIQSDKYNDYSYNATIDQNSEIILTAKKESFVFRLRKLIFRIIKK